MAFTKTSANGKTVYQETYTLPASATIGYSTEIDFLKFDASLANKNVAVILNASAVSGTNLDISLHGTSVAGLCLGCGVVSFHNKLSLVSE